MFCFCLFLCVISFPLLSINCCGFNGISFLLIKFIPFSSFTQNHVLQELVYSSFMTNVLVELVKTFMICVYKLFLAYFNKSSWPFAATLNSDSVSILSFSYVM